MRAVGDAGPYGWFIEGVLPDTSRSRDHSASTKVMAARDQRKSRPSASRMARRRTRRKSGVSSGRYRSTAFSSS